MAYTNRTTVRYKGNMLDLEKMPRKKLESLRTQINLDLADVENQIGWAKYEKEASGIKYEQDWMKKALAAARIKAGDIEKIDEMLEGMPYEKDKAAQDIIELKRAINDYLEGTIGYNAILDRIKTTEDDYGK